MYDPFLRRVNSSQNQFFRQSRHSGKRLRLEPLEDRRLLAILYPVDFDITTEFIGEGEPTSSAPSIPNLLDVSDTGVSSTDNITSFDNCSSENVLQFSVANTVAGATVTLYADGDPIGSTTATDTITIITTDGTHDLNDGLYGITARQTVPGEIGSVHSAPLYLTVDTSIPQLLAPAWLSNYCSDSFGYAYDVDVVGDLAYLAYSYLGLQIIDISNLASPVLVGSYDTGGGANNVTVVGNLAYVPDWNSGLQIIDVSDPTCPALLGEYSMFSAWDVAVMGDLAYVTVHSPGLLQIMKPAIPLPHHLNPKRIFIFADIVSA